MAEQSTFPGDGSHSGMRSDTALAGLSETATMIGASGRFHAPSRHAPAGASRAAAALLTDFGRLIGLPSLYFGDDDCCWLGIGSGHIACIAAQGDSGFLRLHGEVTQLPQERDAPDIARAFAGLLGDNAAIVTRGEVLPFAIDPRRNALVIVATVPLTAPAQLLLDAVEDLVDQLASIKRDPPTFHGAPPAEGNDDEAALTGRHGTAAGHAARRPTDFARFRQSAQPPAVTGELVWRV